MKDSSTVYEFGVRDDGKNHEVVIDPKGKLIKGGKSDAEKDDDDDDEND